MLEAATPLAKDDPECAAVVLDQLAREGVALRTGVEVVRVEKAGPKVRVGAQDTAAGEQTIEGSHLLVATGRRAERRRARPRSRRRPARDARHRGRTAGSSPPTARCSRSATSVGAAQFTHVANYHAGIVIRRALFRLPAKVDEDVIPWVTYTDPELAHVGLTEAAARKRHRAIRVLRAPFHDNDRAQTERETRGHIKVITTPRGVILGATIVGPHAGELITTWTLAIQQQLNIRAVAELIVPYPTLREIGKRAAIGYFTPEFDEPHVAAHHHIPAPFRMKTAAHD